MHKIAVNGALLLLTLAYPAFAFQLEPLSSEQDSFFTRFNPMNATLLFQGGAYSTTQGRNRQHIHVEGREGDDFTVTHHYAQNGLVGAGYFITGIDWDELTALFGVNAFYFGHTTVTGTIIREHRSTPLAYHYSLQNYPIYLTARALINPIDKYTITFMAGIGPNIIKTSNYGERSLDHGITPPENFFAGQTNTVTSAMLSIGFQINNVLGNVPIELAYQVFYLGQGKLEKLNPTFDDPLHAGYNYANALVIAVSI